MSVLCKALDDILDVQIASKKALAVIIAGHNGSGKSSFWKSKLSDKFQIPLLNADRMLLSILPEPDVDTGRIPIWAQRLRDGDERWMKVAQKGIAAFVDHAVERKVAFAYETVFSYWSENLDGTFSSKVDLVQKLQQNGYFVLLVFVGLISADLSWLRVQSRVKDGGHNVPMDKIYSRFPRTQKAIGHALSVVNASILVDNSRSFEEAFTIGHIQIERRTVFDIRCSPKCPVEISTWLDAISPKGEKSIK